METPITEQQVFGRYGDTHHHFYLIFFDDKMYIYGIILYLDVIIRNLI